MTSVAQNCGYRTYSKVSNEDWYWFVEQKPCVQQLWGECMLAEKYGESFNKIETKLSKNAFSEAKRELHDTRFEFKPIQRLTKSGQQKVVGWKVRNLHGAKVKEYWNQTETEVSQKLGEPAVIQDSRFPEEDIKVAHDLGEPSQVVGKLSQNLGELEAVGFDTTGFDSSLLYSYNSSIILDEKEKSGVLTRSGRLELDASTKVTASAPSPDAQLIENKSYAIPEDLSNTEAYSSSSKIKIRTTANNLRGKQEEDLRSLKMMEGEVNKIGAKSASNRAEVTHDEAPPETLPEAAQNAPIPNPVESSVEPPRPALKPRIGVIQRTPNEIMMEARAAYKSRGLDDKGMDGYWGAFQLALNKKMLATIAEGFAANEWELTTQIQSDLLSDYLLFVDKPYMFVRGKNELELTPWSQLPAIVGQKAN